MDGAGFLSAITGASGLAHIPLVVYSCDGRSVREAATALGAFRVLTKPCDLPELLDSVATACSTRANANGR
jgi:CheY-like chemotaxis protein